MAWTDGRLDDLADRMDAGFARNDREIHTLRTEISGLRTEMRGDAAALRTELKGDTAALRTELKGDIARLHSLIVRFGVAILICLVTVIAALIGAVSAGSVGA